MLRRTILTLIMVAGATGIVAFAGSNPVHAKAKKSEPADSAGLAEAKSGASTVRTGGANSSDLGTAFQTVTNILLFIIGAVAVIMLVIGGIKYTVSNGDSNAIQSAKNTILYAIIGIVVAILAYAAVRFVINSF